MPDRSRDRASLPYRLGRRTRQEVETRRTSALLAGGLSYAGEEKTLARCEANEDGRSEKKKGSRPMDYARNVRKGGSR